MNIRISKSTRPAGSVLMMTLFSAMLIGTVLASYLLLVRREDAAMSRSEGWNASLALAEAGVEEALAQLNSGAASFSGDLSANGWGPPAGGTFNLQSRTLRAGRYDVRYDTNSGPNPTINSIGHVTIPALAATLSRQVKVATQPVPLINVALAAKYGITVNGNGISSDSFNSADPAHSGIINGDIASLYGPINLGTPNIKGDLFLGSTATGGAGITSSQVSGVIHTDFNYEFANVAAPTGAEFWPEAAEVGGVLDFAVTGATREYILSPATETRKIVVRPGANVRLYVKSTTFAPIRIEIQTNNLVTGSLTIWQATGGATFPGNGNTLVQGGQATSLKYFGLPGVSSVTYAGNANFTGVIYAPAADLVINNGYTYHWYGTCVARSVTINATRLSFHFDENLLKVGPIRGYFVKSWQEIRPL